MKNFKFQLEPGEQENILSILEQSNDVIIDGVTNDTVSFTIELEDDEADKLYHRLLAEAETKVFTFRKHVIL